MPRWEWIALAYVSYLAALSLAGRFAKARRAALPAALAGWLILPWLRSLEMTDVVRALLPIPVLLAGYWLSGAFFIRPMEDVEESLRRWDARLVDVGLRAWYRRAGSGVHHLFELAYLMAYPMIPLGAITLLAGGRAQHLDLFWSTVLVAAFAAYGALPWVQTRPPRAFETKTDGSRPLTIVRRLNELVLNRASVQVNTVPSGHAAAALAVALAVAQVLPVAGALLLVLALLITAATVLGDYHYAVDSVLGLVVAAAAASLGMLLG